MAKRLVLCAFVTVTLAFAQGAIANVREVTSVYHLFSGKFKLGEVTETLVIEANRYHIESVAKPILGFILPTLTLSSRGTVTADGLRPDHFSQKLSNRPEKTITADFDWDNNVLNLKFNGKEEQHELKPLTFDTLSLRYQFIFTPPTGDGTVFLTTGKKLEEYPYRVLKEETIMTPSGKILTLHVQRVSKQDEPHFDLWLGKDSHYLPVKVVAQDDDRRLEQVLVKIKIDE